MDSEQFMTVLYASEVLPAETCKALVPYRPPNTEELARMPRVPARGEYRFTHPLALALGSGFTKHPENFQRTPNMTGVDVMVCRNWRFIDGVFENTETIVWPGAAMGGDVLVYDPNWPWMQLVITKPDAKKIRMLKAANSAEFPDIEKLLQEKHDWDGKYTWRPGEFRIEMVSLQEDIVDTRSPAQLKYADRFERDRQAWGRYSQEKQNREKSGMSGRFAISPGLAEIAAVVEDANRAVMDVPEIVGKPDPDYSCGAAYCDDPACNMHGPKKEEDE